MINEDFDIIVTSFNALSKLKRCLSSIRKHTQGLAYRITVVDNGSEFPVVNFLNKRKDIQFIDLKRNYGPAKAFNIALKKTKAQFIVRIDDDSEVTPNWLIDIYTSFKRAKTVGIVGMKSIFPDGTIAFAEDLAKYHSAGSYRAIDRGQKNYIRFCDVVSGAGMFFPRFILTRVGLFDQRLSGHEDMDFCFRVRKAGYKILYNGKVTLIHNFLYRFKGSAEKEMEKFSQKWRGFEYLPFSDSHPSDKYNTRGVDYLIRRDFKRALINFEKVKIIDKRLVDEFYVALALWGQKRKKQAHVKFDKIRKINPFDHRVNHFLALVKLKENGIDDAFKIIGPCLKSERLGKGLDIHPSLNRAVCDLAFLS